MEMQNRVLISDDGHRMYTYLFIPDSKPKAIVQIVHGLGEHAGRYAELAGKLNEAGLLYISVLTDPTYGGVTASFASLADIILAQLMV